MIKKRLKNSTITLTITVATVFGYKPLVGFGPRIEGEFRRLQRRRRFPEIAFTDKQESISNSKTKQLLMNFRQREQKEIEERRNDVFSANFTPTKYKRNSAEYGRPKPGTLTEMRAIKAARTITKEMLQLCQVIEEYGEKSNDDVSGEMNQITITFGKLFHIYQYISDKVVGMLLRARKHKMVHFEGEMLFQRRDESTIITLLINREQIESALAKI
ncbi:costars domain-containing protein [Ditylenchus destructor]|nr:costars domain-containing protein [Ditylenchus destructor]